MYLSHKVNITARQFAFSNSDQQWQPPGFLKVYPNPKVYYITVYKSFNEEATLVFFPPAYPANNTLPVLR